MSIFLSLNSNDMQRFSASLHITHDCILFGSLSLFQTVNLTSEHPEIVAIDAFQAKRFYQHTTSELMFCRDSAFYLMVSYQLNANCKYIQDEELWITTKNAHRSANLTALMLISWKPNRLYYLVVSQKFILKHKCQKVKQYFKKCEIRMNTWKRYSICARNQCSALEKLSIHFSSIHHSNNYLKNPR